MTEMSQRSIVHLDADAFFTAAFAAVEKAADARTKRPHFFVDFSQKEFYFVINLQYFERDYGQRFVN